MVFWGYGSYIGSDCNINAKIGRFCSIAKNVSVVSGLIKLLFTGSFLNQEPALYILLGFCINSILEKGTHNENTMAYKHNIT